MIHITVQQFLENSCLQRMHDLFMLFKPFLFNSTLDSVCGLQKDHREAIIAKRKTDVNICEWIWTCSLVVIFLQLRRAVSVQKKVVHRIDN